MINTDQKETPVPDYLTKHSWRFNDAASLEYRLTLLAIFGLGIALRVYAWYYGEGYVYWAINDEMLAYQYALGFLAGEPHTYYLAQPAFADGQLPGPLWTLFWVMLLKLGNDSVNYALLWMTLFNSISIYLFYRIARQFISPGLALASVLFFALSPQAIYSTVGMWNPLPLAVIGGLLLLTLWNTLSHERSQQIFWVCVFSAVVPQFHMIGIFYIPVIVFLLVVSQTSLNKKWLVLGIISGLALYLPYLIGEYYHHFSNTQNMLTGSAPRSIGVIKIITGPLAMLTSIPAGWAGRDFADSVAYANSWFGSVYVLLAFSLLSLIYTSIIYFHFIKMTFDFLKQNWRNPAAALSQQRKMFFLSSIILFPLVLFALTLHSFATRYVMLVITVLYILPAWHYQTIKKETNKRRFILASVLILAFNLYLVTTFFYYQGQVINQSANFSPSFRSMETLNKILVNNLGEDKRINIVLSDNVAALPEGSRKIAVAVTDYFKLMNKYVRKNEKHQGVISLQMELTERLSEDVDKSRIVHQANGMSYLRIEQP